MRVFIGYDHEEDTAAQVCRLSLLKHSSIPLDIQFLDQGLLRRAGLYSRGFYTDHGQRHDMADGKPFSTEFTFTRFLVPALCQWQGVALFCDSDMLWRGDVAALLALHDERYAVQLVKHYYHPPEGRKMRSGQQQTRYHRKNWSSLMLMSCERCEMLIPPMVNSFPGSYLHGFRWLPDDLIGELPLAWNWLSGHSPITTQPEVVHFTLGTPDVPGYDEAPYADEWWQAYGELRGKAA
jgi:hypothetical protein